MMMMVAILISFLISAAQSDASSPIPPPPRWEGTVLSEVINGTRAEQVWPLFQDWCNIYRVFPFDVSFCTEGVQPSTPGLIRYMANKGLPTGGNETTVFWENHRLLEMNPRNRSLTYMMLENNQGVGGYVPTLRVLEKGVQGYQIQWSFVAEIVDGWSLDGIKTYLQAILEIVVVKIQDSLASSTT